MSEDKDGDSEEPEMEVEYYFTPKGSRFKDRMGDLLRFSDDYQKLSGEILEFGQSIELESVEILGSEFDPLAGTPFASKETILRTATVPAHISRDVVYETIRIYATPGTIDEAIAGVEAKFPRKVWGSVVPDIAVTGFIFLNYLRDNHVFPDQD